MNQMYNEDQEALFVRLAGLCSQDIGKPVQPEEVKRFFSISILKLGDPTWAFENYSTEDVADIVATILKELGTWMTTKS